MINAEKIRKDFPILSRKIYGRDLVYFDNAATSQKPLSVIKKESEIYRLYNSNIHRGVHKLSRECTSMYESARETVRKFVNAEKSEEIIFTSGTTASINLVAYSFGELCVGAGDEVLIGESEHHSNIVPWQMMCKRKGAVLKVLPFDDSGDLRIDLLDELLTNRTKIVGIAHISNVLGKINPIETIIKKAHDKGIPVLVDGAQGAVHSTVDVKASDVDFYAFSGHKLYGPAGTGVLYGKEKYLKSMPPWQGGGEMISSVSFKETFYADLPFKFEAGTGNYAGAIGLAAAMDYLNETGISDIHTYEKQLNEYAFDKFCEMAGFKMYGSRQGKTGMISFLLDGIHHADTGEVLDKLGFAVRAGRLCADPVMEHFNVTGMVRASWAFYNNFEEIDALHNALLKVKTLFQA